MKYPLFAPAAALIIWTIVIMVWMAAARGPAISKLGPEKLKLGARGQDLEGLIDDRVMWKAHNYEHLLEQPTIFYATIFILALTSFTHTDVILAWAYVCLRIVHSIWQCTVNRQPVRVLLFLLSSALLVALAIRALFNVV